MIVLHDRPRCLGCGELVEVLHQVTTRTYELRCSRCGPDLVEFVFPVAFTFDSRISRVRSRGWRWSIIARAFHVTHGREASRGPASAGG